MSARGPLAYVLAVSVALIGTLLGGCGTIRAPPPAGRTATSAATVPRPAATASKVAQANASHEYPSSRPPPAQHPARPAISATAAISAFAETYINWNARTLGEQLTLLAASSVGQARSEMQLAAASTARDYELRRGGIANDGTVEAVAPLAGHSHVYIVVTLERTTSSNTSAYRGLRPAWHLTLATVTQVGPAQWALSGWQPEN
jgi:hypothetical protein